MNRIIRLILALSLVGIISVDFAFAEDFRERVSAVETEKDVSSLSDIEAEIVFGRELSARILGNYSLLNDEKINRYVNLVGKAVALHGGRPELIYRFAVLDSDELNAFATPGGYVFITRGALMKMENEAQLAGVLGHEIAHIEKKHVVNELNIRGDEGSGGGIVGLVEGSKGTLKGALEQAVDDAVNILMNRGYKVKDEIEADGVGILLASIAGYHPSALREFLKNAESFEQEDKTYKGEHPMLEVRIEEMDKVLEAHGLQDLEKAKARERFCENVKK